MQRDELTWGELELLRIALNGIKAIVQEERYDVLKVKLARLAETARQREGGTNDAR